MNKAELIQKISETTHLPKRSTDKILTTLCSVISTSVSEGQEVKLVGFGTFDSLQRQERAGRNPQTGLAMTIPATQVPRFRPGKEFKELLHD